MNFRSTLVAFIVPALPLAAMAQATVGGAIGGHAVKNQPFCADRLIVTDRVLADGNHIHQETHGKQCRDSEGRERTEQELPIPGMASQTLISILDPTRGAMIMLDQNRKTA